MESSTNANNPSDPLSNFANLPFNSSPDPSAISLLWNAAQPFLEVASSSVGDGLIGNGEANDDSSASNGVAPSEAAGVANGEPSAVVEASRASEYLTAVSLRIDSLEMAVRYAGMNGMERELLSAEGGMDEGWNVLLPQVLDVVVVSAVRADFVNNLCYNNDGLTCQ
jgi:hypothetical protein